MKRRVFLGSLSAGVGGMLLAPAALSRANSYTPGREAATSVPSDWLPRWEQHILRSSKRRYCDTELGEEIGWLITPFLEGFYYGFKSTGQTAWVERLADWAEAWLKRGVEGPDGYMGWPKRGTGGSVGREFLADSLLGEAMALRPLVLMARDVDKSAPLKERFGAQADNWLKTAREVFAKWDTRECWREVQNGGGWVVPEFGIDEKTGEWTEGYQRRKNTGFSNPANKQNHIARWLLAMHAVLGDPIYRDRAEKWFRRMKAGLRTQENGKYAVWNYWEPAGPWDYKPDGNPRHWVGVHPNGGYYGIDVAGMVAAWERNLVFTREDIERLIATNRDFMWNQKEQGARFRRIDGGSPDPRWENSPGVLWSALVPYDRKLREVFIGNHNPASWGGLSVTPWFLHREKKDGPDQVSSKTR
jgi:hypothetical protein